MGFSLEYILGEHTGVILTVLGVGISIFLAGYGSSIGVGIAGEAAAALIKEKPELFGQALVMQLLPATQGLYGFVIGVILLLRIDPSLSATDGWVNLLASLPVAIAGYTSAPYQGRVSAAGMQLIAQRPENAAQGIVFSAMVETYAILGFVGSILITVFY